MLRPYQTESIRLIREQFSKGKRKVLLRLATGAGKTVIFSEVMKATAAKNKRAIMVVRGRQLVDQASERLFRENVFHGVQMANHWNKKPAAPIQICSIDTLNARDKYPEADLVVIDEAHMATSESYLKFVDQYPAAYFLSVTATPYGKESLRHIGDEVISPISMRELIAQGFLVPARYFAPSEPNLDGVKTVNGDYSSTETAKRMSVLTGDIVGHWKTHGQNRPSLCFAVNLSHSQEIVRQFIQAGIPAEHIEADHSFSERKEAIERLRTGQTRILSNVGILCTGVDIPFASCLILARPTKSYNLYVQQCGRGTRIFPDKNDFIVLDHAGNCVRHGFITDEPKVFLDGSPTKEKLVGPYRCKFCYSVFPQGIFECPQCGNAREIKKKSREIEIAEGILTEISELPKAESIALDIARLNIKCKERGYKIGWVWHQVKQKYGEEIANKTCARTKVPDWILRRTQSPG